MAAPQPSDAPLTVWYDGRCGVCTRSRDWILARAPQRFDFVDFRTEADAALPASLMELESAMWVRATDGRLSSAYEGWRTIMAEIPRWRWLARLGAVPPFTWLGSLGYRLVARWRFRISKLLGGPQCDDGKCRLPE
jgi:predicted DCC family thiol-disulfide oxidoreductase YuxK